MSSADRERRAPGPTPDRVAVAPPLPHARGVLPVGAVLVGPDRFESGALSVEGGRVQSLGLPSPRGLPRSGGRWFAVAGLRNAHVHLDLSAVRDVPRADQGFAQWVLSLMQNRGPFEPLGLQRGAAAGALEALSTGTTSVGDIDSSGAAACTVAAAGLGGVAFREVLGKPTQEEWRVTAGRWLREFPEFAPWGRLQPGLSPHAPYSTREDLYDLTLELAAKRGLRRTTHIAETLAESEWLRTGGGELADMLRAVQAPSPMSRPPQLSPLAWLDQRGQLGPDVLLAHANYPESGDIERVGASGATVVYCPRSHAFFGHSRHPVREYLDAGIPVALGTDSRASNRSLSMLEELRFLRAARPDLSPAELVGMVTMSGARFLDRSSGRLDEGEPADLILVEARSGCPQSLDEALDALVIGDLVVHATIVAGMVCYTRESCGTGPRPLTDALAGLCSAART